ARPDAERRLDDGVGVPPALGGLEDLLHLVHRREATAYEAVAATEARGRRYERRRASRARRSAGRGPRSRAPGAFRAPAPRGESRACWRAAYAPRSGRRARSSR